MSMKKAWECRIGEWRCPWVYGVAGASAQAIVVGPPGLEPGTDGLKEHDDPEE